MSFKVLFICGTFELAKSGVADYIHCLSIELARKGAQCACIALHDPYCSVTLTAPDLQWQRHELPVRRLSSRLSWSIRTDLLKAEIKKLNPDWISFHYVPYAYHSKGIPNSLFRCLGSVISDAKWHIMAHELWVDPNTSLSNRLLCSVQQWIALRLFSKLQPRIFHVSNHGYQSILSSFGIETRILPLFSNIPFTLNISPVNHLPGQWTFVFFGSINRDWKPEPLLGQIEIARISHGIESCQFISVGNLGDYGTQLWDSLHALNYSSFSYTRLGELSSDLVSEQLQHADFGIAVMPSLLVGKSGSVAAMLSHGLPVIISRLSRNCDLWHQSLKHTGHYILLDSSFTKSLVSACKYTPVNTLETTTLQFMNDLEHAI